ncbi:NERD domain-containing protein [Aldersonia sp. NBC_00410]|uniref:nuclease-related domain-containing protein n=1 Tax=Aldersonia sp. NBC_00410 TaxID=2975954 RepID=UPI00224F0971|nr:nuclease-related domain-containing protein [Aldersonia sp. NBC_00410]MCX5045263.1 NERD domain-containing protein [Aldersonia sp. NBC_00410]
MSERATTTRTVSALTAFEQAVWKAGVDLTGSVKALRWSLDGRAYRALERAAIAEVRSPGSLTFVHPTYVDASDVPAFLALGVLGGDGLKVRVFRNRYDAAAIAPGTDELEIALAGATDSRIGDLGEETAAIYLADVHGATIVTMGDSGIPRSVGRQDLDLVVVIGGELAVIEVKTRSRRRAQAA